MLSKLKKIHSHFLRLRLSKALFISLVINFSLIILLIGGAFHYRQEISSQIIKNIFAHFNKIKSYHLTASFNFSDLQFSADYVNNIEKFKQANFNWKYKNNTELLQFIYNRDNLFLKIDSLQFRSFISKDLSSVKTLMPESEFNSLQNTLLNNPFVSGKTHLLFNKEILDSMQPNRDYEKEVLESNTIVNEQILKSFRLASMPSLVFFSFEPHLKIPLRFDYQKLNSILYPSVKSYLIKDQKLMQQIFNRTTIDLYVNIKGEVVKIIISTPALSQNQIKQILDDKPNHSQNIIWQFNDHLIDYFSKINKSYLVTLEFSRFNQNIDIPKPKNGITVQDLMKDIITAQSKQKLAPTPKPQAKYTINNAFKVKSVGVNVDKNFYMIYNMLYRYYNEHGSYPSSLDALAGKYFPGMVPGNPQTAQGFFYQTFDNSKGYLLCPTAASAREYCFKKFNLDEIN
jgi:hypothetical protein